MKRAHHEEKEYFDTIVHKEEILVCDWPTDTVYIHAYDDSNHQINAKVQPNFVIFFIPGNPGCIGWYVRFLSEIISKIGPKYVAHGISYAGHGTVQHQLVGFGDLNRDFPWTLKGQIDHKIEFVDQLAEKYDYDGNVRYIFISHSIGSHMVQRINILRPDILLRTSKILYLMPFIRFDPALVLTQKFPLSFVANLPRRLSVGILNLASQFAANTPIRLLDEFMKGANGVECVEGRCLAIELVRQPEMASNFLTLGIEELRDLPQKFDEAAFKIICQKCPMFILYCGSGGPDQWAPLNHMLEVIEKQNNGSFPRNVHLQYRDDLVHGFVVIPDMIDPVVQFVIESCSGKLQGVGGLTKVHLKSTL